MSARTGQPDKAVTGTPHGRETVLVVEDDEAVRELAREILEKNGYTVLEARHGVEALLISDRHNGPIHLLLTDVIMPQLNGRDLAQRLTSLRPDAKVLYMSGYTTKDLISHGMLDPGVAFLQKPFTPDGLALKVRQILDAPRQG